MPEGPEILRNSSVLTPMIGEHVSEITVLSGRYLKKLIEKLDVPIGQKVLSIKVKGKLIAIMMERDAILTTAGMAGRWTRPDYKSSFRRIKMVVGPHTFYFADMRNFGTFKVVSHDEAAEKFDSLGVDIFRNDEKVVTELLPRIKKFGKKQRLCELLMDQRVFAGVGNYIRAEAMYLAEMDPLKPASELTEDDVAKIWEQVHGVATSSFALGNRYVDVCYSRLVAANGKKVHSFVDNNKRTVWHV